MKYDKWWQYPANKHENIFPGYLIIIRVPLGIIAYAGLTITYICIMLGWGIKDANSFWEDSH